jgi:hypothetical protein
MTDLTTDELRALLEAATPGPWIVEADRSHYDTMTIVVAGDERQKPPPVNQMCVSVGGFADIAEAEANTALIAAAPSLAAEVLALREERERLRGALALADKALRPAVVQAAGGPRIAEIGAWLATADDAIGLIEAALAEPQP